MGGKVKDRAQFPCVCTVRPCSAKVISLNELLAKSFTQFKSQNGEAKGTLLPFWLKAAVFLATSWRPLQKRQRALGFGRRNPRPAPPFLVTFVLKVWKYRSVPCGRGML